jgi:hypothetical protein
MLNLNRMPSENRRRVIFAALIDAEDRTRSLKMAKEEVVAQFGITWAVAGEIEREGMNNEWPPLNA